MEKVRELADYPILIITDGESGAGEFLVGKHNAIGTAGTTKHAYAFGKAVGVTARKMGYNVVCDPVVDMIDGSMRSMGTDKEKVAELALAIARGITQLVMHVSFQTSEASRTTGTSGITACL